MSCLCLYFMLAFISQSNSGNYYLSLIVWVVEKNFFCGPKLFITDWLTTFDFQQSTFEFPSSHRWHTASSENNLAGLIGALLEMLFSLKCHRKVTPVWRCIENLHWHLLLRIILILPLIRGTITRERMLKKLLKTSWVLIDIENFFRSEDRRYLKILPTTYGC